MRQKGSQRRGRLQGLGDTADSVSQSGSPGAILLLTSSPRLGWEPESHLRNLEGRAALPPQRCSWRFMEEAP